MGPFKNTFRRILVETGSDGGGCEAMSNDGAIQQ